MSDVGACAPGLWTIQLLWAEVLRENTAAVSLMVPLALQTVGHPQYRGKIDTPYQRLGWPHITLTIEVHSPGLGGKKFESCRLPNIGLKKWRGDIKRKCTCLTYGNKNASKAVNKWQLCWEASVVSKERQLTACQAYAVKNYIFNIYTNNWCRYCYFCCFESITWGHTLQWIWGNAYTES